MWKYRRITYEDRCQIYALSKRGASQEGIAGVLGVSQSTVSREMCRNRGRRGYRFKQAEAKAQARQAIRSRPRKLTAPLRRKIEAKLRQMRWSPEQISGWLFEQGIKLSHERIYEMIWQDKRDGGDLWRSLRRRGKRYNKRGGKNAGRGLIPDRIDISECPTIVARKARLGDWEGDTVVSAGHKGGLLTLVERKTQLAKIIKLPRDRPGNTEGSRASPQTYRRLRAHHHPRQRKEFAAHRPCPESQNLLQTPTVSSATSSRRGQTSLRSPTPRLPRSSGCSTQDLANPSASVHPKRFSTPSLTRKVLRAGNLNPRDNEALQFGNKDSDAASAASVRPRVGGEVIRCLSRYAKHAGNSTKRFAGSAR
jgi:IS30 family transposase